MYKAAIEVLLEARMNCSSMESAHSGGYHQARTWMLLEDQTVAEHRECTAEEQAGDSGMYSGTMAVCFEGWSRTDPENKPS